MRKFGAMNEERKYKKEQEAHEGDFLWVNWLGVTRNELKGNKK